MSDKYEQLRFDNAAGGGKSSFLTKYQDLVVGDRSLFKLVQYELITTLFGQVPGALGLVCRSLFYPSLFMSVGKKVLFGHHLSLRAPGRIKLGNKVVLDDFAVISVRGLEDERIEIGDGVQIGRSAQLKTRAGSIWIGEFANIGSECRIDSTSSVHIGRYCLIAGRCYIGGVSHGYSRTDIPIVKQPLIPKGGVHIGDDVWLGAHVIVNDGVTIGTGAIVGAGAVVTKDIPPYAIAMGVPAQVRGWRKEPPASSETEPSSTQAAHPAESPSTVA